MTTNPLVSVIIPLYNGELFIKETIQSVLEQTHQNIEIIIIDDCSIDHSAQIVQNILDNRIKYVRNDVNLGLNKNLKKGIDLATGDYISLLGHDDLYVVNKLEKQISHIQQSNLDGVYANSYILNKDGSTTENNCPEFYKKVLNNDKSLMEDIYIPDYKVILPMSQSALFKAFVLKDTNYIREKVRLDDWPILVKTFEKYNIGFMNDPMFYWRQHDNNMHKNFWYSLTISVEALSEVIPVEMRLKCLGNNLSFAINSFLNHNELKTGLKFLLASFCLNPTFSKFKQICYYSKRHLNDILREKKNSFENKVANIFSNSI